MPFVNFAGWQRESVITTPTWPSTSSAIITERLPLLGLSPAYGVEKRFHNDGHGPVGFSNAAVRAIAPRFSLDLELRYQGLEQLFAAALGLEAKRLGATVMPEQLAPGVYRHLYELDHVLSAMAPWDVPDDGIQSGDISAGQRKVRRGTVAAVRDVGVWEWRSAMVDQLSLAITTDAATVSLQCLAHSLDLAPTTNTTTTMQRAIPNTAPTVTLQDAVVRLAPYSAVTPLDVYDEIAVSSLSFTLQNQLRTMFGPRTGLAPEEFERAGPALMQGSLLEPRYTDNTRVNAWPANTRYMLSILCTGPEIPPQTGYHYELNLYVPGFFFTQAEPSGLAVARSSLPLNWVAAAPDTRPAGFPVTARQTSWVVEVVSGVSSHGLL